MELTESNTKMFTDLEAVQLKMAASKAETADFERDPNQGSMAMSDLNADAEPAPKEKRFLLNELK